jgi:hypothetical protein
MINEFSMEKKTRAQQMVDRLHELEQIKNTEKSNQVKSHDKETPEMKERLKIAREKLATFKDLLG